MQDVISLPNDLAPGAYSLSIGIVGQQRDVPVVQLGIKGRDRRRLVSLEPDHGEMTEPCSLKEVNKELEALGVKVLAQYAVLGPYDFVNIVEAPDNGTIARVSAELSSRGSVRILTMATIPIDEFIASFK